MLFQNKKKFGVLSWSLVLYWFVILHDFDVIYLNFSCKMNNLGKLIFLELNPKLKTVKIQNLNLKISKFPTLTILKHLKTSQKCQTLSKNYSLINYFFFHRVTEKE
jgi:hypothetical protein